MPAQQRVPSPRVTSPDTTTLTTAPDRGSVLMIEQGGRGGVADYTAQLTTALGAAGWRVRLATADDHRYAPGNGVSICRVFHYVRGRTRLAKYARSFGLGMVMNGLRFAAAIPGLVRLSRRADIVHCQGWEFAPLGLLAVACLRATDVPVVQTAHNTFERGRPWKLTHRLLARLTVRTIVHTEADVARVPREAHGKVAVIPHGEYGPLARTGGEADRDRARAQLRIDPATPVTLMFGQLRPDKGLADLLAAVRRIPRLHLIIAGQEAGALAASSGMLADPELAERLTVREGFVEMAEAAQLFAASDSVALPYRRASQSGVLLLAYGFKRPVVIYPVGGLIEAVVDGETGWVCARRDVDALVEALGETVDGGWAECRRRGEAGHRLAAERYAWPRVAARTAELYRDVLRTHAQPE
jgi:glycosyltransferase involved in cell wall biosynthesis